MKTGEEKLIVSSPYDQQLIKQLGYNSSADVEKALCVARKLADSPREVLSVEKRTEILKKTAELVEQRIDELTLQSAMEGGKPYADSLVELKRAINGIEESWVSIGKIKGEEIAMGLNAASANRLAMTVREPIGVVVAVSAFNHPFNLIVHQVVPAIAIGCPVIVKPALTTPLSCLSLLEILYEAGLPRDWAQCLILDNENAEKLVTDARVDFFSFIGSAKVGWMLKGKLAAGARCALEHGGAAPVIVEADMGSAENADDFKTMIAKLSKGGFYHAGQVCVSVQRVFCNEKLVESLTKQLADFATKLIVGDPTKKDTEVGPLILPREVDRVESWVNHAVEKGAKLICGGKRIGDTCFQPTVLLNPPDDVEVSQSEIFGPVVCVYATADIDESIKRANAVPYSFQSAVFSKNIDSIMKSVRLLNAAAVMVNDHSAFRVDWMPFAGRKISGLGVGGIEPTMLEMTEEKLIVFNSAEL